MKDTETKKERKRDDNIYVKETNGRYRPYGCRYDEPYLMDGVWYVRHHPGSTATTSVGYMEGLFRVGERPQKLDVQKLCAMQDYKDYILRSDAFKEIMDRGSYSWDELMSKVISLVIELNDTYKKDEKW